MVFQIPPSIQTIALYNASHVTTELLLALQYTLGLLFQNLITVSSVVQDNNILYIIICVEGFPIRNQVLGLNITLLIN